MPPPPPKSPRERGRSRREARARLQSGSAFLKETKKKKKKKAFFFFFFSLGKSLSVERKKKKEFFFSEGKRYVAKNLHNFAHLAAANPRCKHRRRGGREEDGLLGGRAAEDQRFFAKGYSSPLSGRAPPEIPSRHHRRTRARHLEDPAGHRLERPQALHSLDHSS